MMIPDPSEQEGAQRTGQKARAECAERFDHRSGERLGGEEMTADRNGKVAINRKVIPFEDIADHAGTDQPAIGNGNRRRGRSRGYGRSTGRNLTSFHAFPRSGWTKDQLPDEP